MSVYFYFFIASNFEAYKLKWSFEVDIDYVQSEISS